MYLAVKYFHVTCVVLSFALFIFRGGLMMVESSWLSKPVLRITPHVIDTLLLTSALWLMALTHIYPIAHSWLTLKIALLVGYIVLGSFALKRGRTKRQRIGYFIAAATVFVFMFSVARAHHPAGFLAPLLG